MANTKLNNEPLQKYSNESLSLDQDNVSVDRSDLSLISEDYCVTLPKDQNEDEKTLSDDNLDSRLSNVITDSLTNVKFGERNKIYYTTSAKPHISDSEEVPDKKKPSPLRKTSMNSRQKPKVTNRKARKLSKTPAKKFRSSQQNVPSPNPNSSEESSNESINYYIEDINPSLNTSQIVGVLIAMPVIATIMAIVAFRTLPW